MAETETKPKENIPAIFGTTDHQILGQLWIAASLVFGIFSLVGGILLTFQQRNGNLFENADRHLAFFSTYRVALIFLFLVPLILGIAIYIVPRQIGAKSLVYARAGLGAFWAWLAGAILFITAWAIDGGLAPGGDQEAVELSLLALGLVVLSILVAVISLLATIIVSRTQNMTLWQVPMFSWSMLTAGGIWLLTLPVLLGNIITAWIDLRGSSAVYFGSAENLYSQIEWIFDQPQVFIFAVPVLGIFSDILISAKGKQMKRYEIVQILIAGISVLSFGAYAQEFFYPDVSQTPIFVVSAILFGLVLLALIGGWLTYAKDYKVTPPLIISTVGLLIFALAGAIAVLRVVGDLLHFLTNFATGNADYQNSLRDFLDPLLSLKGSVIANSVLHLVIIAGLLGAFSGLHYWAPKILGKKLGTINGIGITLVGLGGAILWALGDIINGFLELPESPLAQANFEITDGMRFASLLSILGAILVVLALLGIVVEVIRSINQLSVGQAIGQPEESLESEPASANPWNAPTLEWSQEEPTSAVTNAYPLWSSAE